MKREKKMYSKPSMRVFELRQSPQLLAGSAEHPEYTPTEW